jgi:TRAP-type C4-dicarboxylate transport system permease small subunit
MKSTNHTLIEKSSDVLALAASWILLAMTLLVTADVIFRYFFNNPLVFAAEVSEFMMAAVILFGFAHTFQKGEHVRVELLLGGMVQPVRRRLRIVTLFLASLFLVFFNWQALNLVAESYSLTQKSAVMLFPLWIPQLMMAVGGIMFLVAVLSAMIQLIKNKNLKDTYV